MYIGRDIRYWQNNVLAKHILAEHFISEHAPPEENCGLGHRVAIFSKVAKQASVVEIGIISLSTNEQSRGTQGRGTVIDVLVSDSTYVLILDPRLLDKTIITNPDLSAGGGVLILWT